MSKFLHVIIILNFSFFAFSSMKWQHSFASDPVEITLHEGLTTDDLLQTTPEPPETAPVTEHRFLQSMILLSVVMVIVILFGIWSNRDGINME